MTLSYALLYDFLLDLMYSTLLICTTLFSTVRCCPVLHCTWLDLIYGSLIYFTTLYCSMSTFTLKWSFGWGTKSHCDTFMSSAYCTSSPPQAFLVMLLGGTCVVVLVFFCFIKCFTFFDAQISWQQHPAEKRRYFTVGVYSFLVFSAPDLQIYVASLGVGKVNGRQNDKAF